MEKSEKVVGVLRLAYFFDDTEKLRMDLIGM